MKIHKIPNQIIKGRLTPLIPSKVTGLALHHMATNADIKTIERGHINQGWSAIGYNFWVAFDGTIYEGRGFNQGAGVDKQNSTVISIGFQGDYHNKPVSMPDEQFNAGIDIISYVKSKLPYIRKIGGHKDFMATACPGRYFPLDEMISGKKREVDEVKRYDWIKDMPDWAKPTVEKLYNRGIIKGDENGALNLTEDIMRMLVWHDRIGLYD